MTNSKIFKLPHTITQSPCAKCPDDSDFTSIIQQTLSFFVDTVVKYILYILLIQHFHKTNNYKIDFYKCIVAPKNM